MSVTILKRGVTGFASVILMIPFITLQAAPPEPELTEELIFQPIKTVITAGRTEQSIERAPATIAVISSEEIKASGALSIPELLRQVPGLDVMTVSSSHSEVNARGLNQLLSNKMLVLVDGRSTYFDFFGGVIWQALPIVMDQIDRIEVVRSPSSALYGANAFSGVINIITKTPRQIQGGRLKVQGGENSTLYSSFVQGNRKGDTGYRVVLGTRRMDSFSDQDTEFEDVALGNFYVDHRFDNDAKLSMEAGLIRGTIWQNVRLEDVKFKATTSYTKMNLDYGPFTLQAFWNRGDETSDPFFPGGKEDVEILYNTFDLEAQHKVDLGLTHTFIYGTTYRFNTIESSLIDTEHKQNLIAGYFQDEYRPVPEVSLLAGVRVDRHPLVGVNFSPRGSMIYAPTPSHTLRVSVGRAFRNPSFTDSYIQVEIPLPPPIPGMQLVGEPDLDSEKITTYELGFTYFPRHYFRWEIDVFAYKFSDYIALGAPDFSSGIPVQSCVNLGSATAYGFELIADLIPASWLKFSANYSFQDLDNKYTVLQQQSPPKNKVNFKSFLSLPSGLSASFSASFVGKNIWEIATPSGDYQVTETKSHTRCDARLAYNPGKKNLELFAAAFNLFDSRHLEYPLGEKVGRRATAGMSFSF